MINASLILWLYRHGYRQKIIQIITGYNQSSISKYCHPKKDYVPSLQNINDEQLVCKYVVDRILECRELPTESFTEQDKYYIKLLDYLLVDKEKIRKMYFNISQYKISQTLRSKKIDFRNFQPQLIGLTDDEYNIFLDKVKNISK